MRARYAIALTCLMAVAGCGESDTTASATSSIEDQVSAYVDGQSGRVSESTCEEAKSDGGWDCVVTLETGKTVKCGAGGSPDHPEFACIE
jgi:hypothetical protein